MSNGAKWYCPDVFGGPVYTPDELGEIVDGETGEVVTVAVKPVQVAAPAPVIDVEPTDPDPAPSNGNDAPVTPGLNADLELMDWRQFHEAVVRELHTGAVAHNTAILNKAYGPAGWSKKSKTELWATIAQHMSEKQVTG